MKPVWKRWLWPGVKIALALAVLLVVGWQFQRDLERLDLAEIELRPGWLLASGGLYLLGLFPAAWYWRHLNNMFGYPIPLYAAVRAHFIGQLGKYVPGKAMAIIIRSYLIYPHGVPFGVSVISSFYEVFAGMAAGAIIAALIYMIEAPGGLVLHWHPVTLGLVLIGLCGIPLLPGVFNFVIARLTAKFQAVEQYHLPPVRFDTLALGLSATGVGWSLQGLSVWAMLQAVLPEPPDWSLSVWAQCTAGIAFANVAGFVIVFMPGGLGVREILLSMLLSSFGPYVAASVLLLRLDWILAETSFAAVAYWIKPATKDASNPPKDEASES